MDTRIFVHKKEQFQGYQLHRALLPPASERQEHLLRVIRV